MLEQQIAELNKNITVLIQTLQNLNALQASEAATVKDERQLELPLDNPNEEQPKPEQPKTKKKATVQDVQNALVAFSGSHGKDVARALLNSFKAQKVGDLDPSQYAEIVEAINAATQERAA